MVVNCKYCKYRGSLILAKLRGIFKRRCKLKKGYCEDINHAFNCSGFELKWIYKNREVMRDDN